MQAVRSRLWLVLVFWPLTGWAAGPDLWLVLSGEEPERVLAYMPLKAGTPFHLEFINSIYLAPVRETFVYQPGEGLSVVEVESPCAGVFEYYGLIPDRLGKAQIRRKLGNIRLLSHDYENHRLTLGDRSIPLKGLIADGQPLIISVRTAEACRP